MGTIHKLSEYNVWWNCLKFSNKMDLSIGKRRFNNSKHRHAICLKFGDLVFTLPTKLVLDEKASICSKIKENPLLYYRKLLVFVIDIIVLLILIT